jgi:hypothetical protein
MICVFGVTGSASVTLVRPLLKEVIGLDGTMMEGPNSYRVGSVLLVSPMYAAVLLTVGTVVGRHPYFAGMAKQTISRFLPSPLATRLKCPGVKR